MTDRQRQAIGAIRRDVLSIQHGHVASDYEIKRFDIYETHESSVSLIVQTGLIGDEGTYAELYARTKRVIAIGPKGGIRLINTARLTKAGKLVLSKVQATGRRVLWALTY